MAATAINTSSGRRVYLVVKNIMTIMLPFHRQISLAVTLPLACITLLSSPSFAQAPQPENTTKPDLSPVELEPVTVHSTAMPVGSLTSPPLEAQEEALRSTPGGTNLIDETQYTTGRAANLEDMLRSQPGILMGSRGPLDEMKLSIRGSAPDRNYHLRGVRLLQDGIPFSQADGNADFQWMEPLAYKNVEVYRGGNALQYGGTTLGGTINLISHTGYTAPRFQARVETGSYGYIKGQISSGNVIGNLDYYVSASSAYQNGYQEYSRSSSQHYMGNIGYKFTPKLETRIFGGFTNSRQQLPGSLTKSEVLHNPRAAAPNSLDFNQQHNIRYFYLANKTTYQINEEQEISVSPYWIQSKLHHPLFWNQFFLNGMGILEHRSNTYGSNLRYTNTHDLFGKKNAFTFGFNPHLTFSDNKRFQNISGNYRGAKTADSGEFAANFDIYAENQHYVFDKLALITGGQLSYAVRNYNDRFNRNPNGNQTLNQDYVGVSPKIGLLYNLTPTTQVFANFNRSFEPPTSLELIQLGGTAGNVLTSPLRAQTASTIEFGSRGSHKRIAWDMTYYHSWVRNELLTLNDSLGNSLGTLNASRTYHQGVESALSWVVAEGIFAKNSKRDNRTALANIGPGLSPATANGKDRLVLRQVYNWTHVRFENDPVYGKNKLPGIPPHLYRSELLYEHPSGFYVQPNLEWSLTRYSADYANTLSANPYAILSVRTGYKSKRGWSAFVEFKNVTNKRYASAVQVVADARQNAPVRAFSPGLGFSVYGGLEYRW